MRPQATNACGLKLLLYEALRPASASLQVTDVWVAGKQLVKAKTLTQMDESMLKASALEWGAKIKAHHDKARAAEFGKWQDKE